MTISQLAPLSEAINNFAKDKQAEQDRKVVNEIVDILVNSPEWSADTLDGIATVLTNYGYNLTK